MRVIPVLDLLAGHVVRAQGGVRSRYAPVRSVLADPPGDAVALARAFRRTLGCAECYVADLDAITGGPCQRALLDRLAGIGSRLLADVGATTPEQASAVLGAGVERVVVGLETLTSFDALAAIVRAHGRKRVVFSLDLRGGEPVVLPGAPHRAPARALVDMAVQAGVGAVVVIDVARVGSGSGLDLELCADIRHAHQDLELLAGGGIASPQDLAAAAAAGCDGALVASALHDGRLDAASLAAVGRPGVRHDGHSSDSR
jgi:phosphoribosylformimino-5-aminoimidazole carboxamide ribotide isomerase